MHERSLVGRRRSGHFCFFLEDRFCLKMASSGAKSNPVRGAADASLFAPASVRRKISSTAHTNATDFRLETTIRACTRSVVALKFSPNGKYLASAGTRVQHFLRIS